MAIVTNLETLIPALRGHQSNQAVCDEAVEASAAQEFAAKLGALGDEQLLEVKAQMLTAHRWWSAMMQSLTGVVVARSNRAFGHGGLAAKQGHRSAVSLLQEDLGVGKAEAARIVRVAEAVSGVSGAAARPDSATTGADREAQAVADAEARAHAEAEARARAESGDDSGVDAGASSDGTGGAEPWDEPLKIANRTTRLSTAQFHAIVTGLGEPPQILRDHEGNPVDDDFTPLTVGDDGAPMTITEADDFDEQAKQAWRCAAEDLIGEARVRTVSDLRAHARSIRDLLDPEGAERRFTQRHEARAFHMISLDNGATKAIWTMDDVTALFVASAMDAAMRPRRGGPRFVDSAENTAATALRADPRTNDQLAHDLIADIFRAGVLADADSVFGTRQPGVRLVQTVTTGGARANSAHAEDHLAVLPGTVADQHLCTSGGVPVSIDEHGNPLKLGRTTRLFSTKQRLALAVRDGGCRWPHCDRPASYCEAHHIDPWEAGGSTDIDRGILLCQYHHLTLHNNRWRISREGSGDFVLNHADHPPQTLTPRAPLKYAWNQATIPPRRFRSGTSSPTQRPDRSFIRPSDASGARPPGAPGPHPPGAPGKQHPNAPGKHPSNAPGKQPLGTARKRPSGAQSEHPPSTPRNRPPSVRAEIEPTAGADTRTRRQIPPGSGSRPTSHSRQASLPTRRSLGYITLPRSQNLPMRL